MKHTLSRKMSREKESLARKILRTLGTRARARGFVWSSGTQEVDRIHSVIPLGYSDWKSINTAFLEAERKKAKALMETRRHYFI